MAKPVLIYMGTPAFAVPALETLCAAGLAPAVVYSQPDRPRGRGRKLAPTPVAETARRLGLELRQPAILQTKSERERLEAIRPDVVITAAYGKILRRRWREMARCGAVNLHPSLLPRYRGMNPVGRAIIRGDAWTGITTFRLDEGTDTGPILLQEATPIGPEETFGELETRLAVMGADVLVRTVRGLLDGAVTPQPQDDEFATHAPPFSDEERVLTWLRPALQVHDQVRALSPAPGAETPFRGERIKVLKVRPFDVVTRADTPGRVIPTGKGRPPRVACAPGSVELLEVRPPGKASMAGDAWLRGLSGSVDVVLGPGA